MKLFYTLIDALDFLKSEIEEFEQRKREEKSNSSRRTLERLIYVRFYQGIDIIKYASPGEVDKEVVSFFLKSIAMRPDLKQLERMWKDEEERLINRRY